MFWDFGILRVTGRAFRDEYGSEALLAHALKLRINPALTAPIGNSLAHRGPHVYLGSAASNHGLRQRHYDRSHIKAAKAIDSTGSVGAHCTPSETGADLSKHILCVVQNAEELPNIKDEWIVAHADECLYSTGAPKYGSERSLSRGR